MWKAYKTVCSCIGILIYIGLCLIQYRLCNEVKHMKKRSETNTDHKLLIRTRRMSKNILAAFGVSYLPYIVLAIYQRVFGTTDFLEIYFQPWCDFIFLCNALWDPLIYCLRMKSIRNTIKDNLFCHKKVKIPQP